MGEVSERFTDSSDGRKLQAWVVKPPFFDPSKKYPAVFFIHGGPQGAWTDSWSNRWNPQIWAAYGYVVYAANPRGSTGFGQEFLDAISGDWGGQVYDDLMRQADDLASLPFVDRTRIGAAGRVLRRLHGQLDRRPHGPLPGPRVARRHVRPRLRQSRDRGALVPEVGVRRLAVELRPVRRSGTRCAPPGNFKTPTLVITSERDYRVPFGQGLQLFTALQIQNVPSKLLTFPDEGHWVLKPGNSCLWHNDGHGLAAPVPRGAEADPKGLALAYSVTK